MCVSRMYIRDVLDPTAAKAHAAPASAFRSAQRQSSPAHHRCRSRADAKRAAAADVKLTLLDLCMCRCARVCVYVRFITSTSGRCA